MFPFSGWIREDCCWRRYVYITDTCISMMYISSTSDNSSSNSSSSLFFFFFLSLLFSLKIPTNLLFGGPWPPPPPVFFLCQFDNLYRPALNWGIYTPRCCNISDMSRGVILHLLQTASPEGCLMRSSATRTRTGPLSTNCWKRWRRTETYGCVWTPATCSGALPNMWSQPNW